MKVILYWMSICVIRSNLWVFMLPLLVFPIWNGLLRKMTLNESNHCSVWSLNFFKALIMVNIVFLHSLDSETTQHFLCASSSAFCLKGWKIGNEVQSIPWCTNLQSVTNFLHRSQYVTNSNNFERCCWLQSFSLH